MGRARGRAHHSEGAAVRPTVGHVGARPIVALAGASLRMGPSLAERGHHVRDELLETPTPLGRPFDHEIADAAFAHPLIGPLHFVPGLADRKARGAQDRPRIATGFFGGAIDNRGDLRELARTFGPPVPRIGMTAGDGERPPSSLSSDPDRRMRPLHRLWVVRGAAQAEMLPL